MVLFQANLDINIIFKECYYFLTTQNPACQPNIIGFILSFDTPKVRKKQNMTDFPSWLYCLLIVWKGLWKKLYLISAKFLTTSSPCYSNVWWDFHPGSHSWGLLNAEVKQGRHTSPTTWHKQKKVKPRNISSLLS